MDLNLDHCEIEQGFGVNPAMYKPLAGHPAIDMSDVAHGGFGSPIHSPVDQLVYKVLTPAHPSNDGSGFTGVFGIVDNGIELYELLEGHCDPLVEEDTLITKGFVLGTEANHGTVYAGGVLVTLAEQKAGSHAGAHRHVQKRPVMKVLRTRPNYQYLSRYSDYPAGSIYRDGEGYYYEIWDYNNKFNGCIDPSKSVFNRDLQNGMSGYDVYVLQRILVKEKVAPFEPTGFFGALTQAALIKFQDKIGIHPDIGYFGPITRSAMIGIYSV